MDEVSFLPRIARIKTNAAVYHIMSRSISELDLFKDDEDKNTYLSIIKHYQRLYIFKIYAYCLMDNHLHLIIDTNGSDISKIMHSINLKYVCYFNKKYKRHGHLFQDRFKSKIVYDDRYLIALSAYIHNNPSDLPEFSKQVHNFRYSSLGVYLGLRSDTYKIVDCKFILELIGDNITSARKHYINIVIKSNSILAPESEEFVSEKTEYRSERKLLARSFSYKEIVEFASKMLNVNSLSIHISNNRKLVNYRALIIFLLKGLCNLSCKDICCIIGNITQSRVSKLCSIGGEFIDNDEKYKELVYKFAAL